MCFRKGWGWHHLFLPPITSPLLPSLAGRSDIGRTSPQRITNVMTLAPLPRYARTYRDVAEARQRTNVTTSDYCCDDACALRPLRHSAKASAEQTPGALCRQPTHAQARLRTQLAPTQSNVCVCVCVRARLQNLAIYIYIHIYIYIYIYHPRRSGSPLWRFGR